MAVFLKLNTARYNFSIEKLFSFKVHWKYSRLLAHLYVCWALNS